MKDVWNYTITMEVLPMSISIPKEKLVSIQVVDYLKKGFEVYKSNISTLLVGFLISIGLTIVTAGILSGAMFAGFIRLCSRLARPQAADSEGIKAEAPKATDVFDGFNVFLPALLLVVGVAVLNYVLSIVFGWFGTIGNLVDVLVGLTINGATVAIALPLIAFEKTTSVTEAVKVAVDSVKAAPSQTILLFISASFLGYIGVLALGIGIILTIPFTFCVFAVLFNDLFLSEGSEEEVTVMQANG
jgi:hypothetical protein